MRTPFSICGKRNTKALMRLHRQKAFNHIIERLAAHRGGKTFMVDTNSLKVEPPCITVTERFSTVRLAYAKQVAALVTYNDRKLTIEIINGTITYIIY